MFNMAPMYTPVTGKTFTGIMVADIHMENTVADTTLLTFHGLTFVVVSAVTTFTATLLRSVNGNNAAEGIQRYNLETSIV